MADPVLYGYKIIKGAAAASQTIDLTTLLDPSGAALGPALGGQFTVVHIVVGHTTNRNPAATGYTVVMDGYATDTQGTALWVGHKFQPSTPDTSITVTASGSSGSSLIAIATVWDNVDPTTPLDGVATVNLSTANTALPNPGSITPATTGAVILFGVGNSHNAGVTAISESYMDWSVGDSRDGTNDASALVGYVSGGVAATPYDGAALTWAGTDSTALSNCSNVMVLRPTAGGSPQTITGAVYTDTDAFGAGTVSASFAITGALYSDADAFGAGTVIYDQAITGALHPDADSFGSGTVSAAYTITGALYADPDSFGAGTLAASYIITGALYADPDSFGAGVVVYDQAITGALFAGADTFGSGTVALAGGSPQTITGALYADADTFPTGAVSTAYAIAGAAHSDADSFGAGAVTSSYTIGGAVVANTSTFGAGALSTFRAIIGALYASANSFGAGSISIVGSLPTNTGHGIWPTGARYVRTVSSNERAANALGDGRYIRILGRG